ncbi:hypothetical protein Niako_6404 [Niastella koreensis GR20-10]|uniref:Uncharacterized protein n=1 Tax=Niastella koreensis (strain DSM 17620 / KACC 11465 / NBRC 106392 / GR20-10) TaxID=700598 RepID=G8TDZ4_NIAKG|nr:hypothetical protein Niako_6404 [Niastella koreensis GR20-10]
MIINCRYQRSKSLVAARCVSQLPVRFKANMSLKNIA